MIEVGIFGASGYMGGEALRINALLEQGLSTRSVENGFTELNN